MQGCANAAAGKRGCGGCQVDMFSSVTTIGSSSIGSSADINGDLITLGSQRSQRFSEPLDTATERPAREPMYSQAHPPTSTEPSLEPLDMETEHPTQEEPACTQDHPWLQ